MALATILFASFVIFFYAPDLIFRFGAASVYGLRTPKAASQVREFFAAGLPSVFLNLETWLLFVVARAVFRQLWFVPDMKQLHAIFSKDPNFSGVTGHDVLLPIFYLGALYVNAFRLGLAYGEESRLVAAAGGILEHFSSVPRWRYARYRFWYLFYSQHHDSFYPIVLRSSVAYVHTKTAIFHGRIIQNDKDRDGEHEAIYLVDVSKYNRSEQDKILERGENPITQMSGPVYLKWSEIIDINFPPEPDDTLDKKRRYFDERLRTAPHQKSLPIRYEQEDDEGTVH